MSEPLDERRALLGRKILRRLREPLRYAAPPDAGLKDLIHSVKAQALEALVAKRRDSRYEPGRRSAAWQKMRINSCQEFVIGCTKGTNTFDALIFGHYEGGRLLYAARTRNGFTPATRTGLFKQLKPLTIAACPLANLPEKGASARRSLPRRCASAMGQAGAGRSIRVRRMDTRSSSPSFEVHCCAR
jgi:bifunctional non-homologous end joining protein LigD